MEGTYGRSSHLTSYCVGRDDEDPHHTILSGGQGCLVVAATATAPWDDRPVRVAVDATPLLGLRTGVGRYVRELVDSLVRSPRREGLEIRLVPMTMRGRRELKAPPGATTRGCPVPARLLQVAWARSASPPVEWISGGCDVFHATNFVLPPRRGAAGVVTIHDLTFLHFPAAVEKGVLRYRELVPRSVSSADMIVCPSAAVAGEVTDTFRVPTDRIMVTPLGVDSGWFRAIPCPPSRLSLLGLPESYLLFVGTREPRKQLATLISAHRMLLTDDSDTPDLVLVGPAGWGAQPATGPRLHILDYVPDEDLKAVVAGAQAVVMPSRYEGFGLPILEALACGVPVVASDIAAHREVGGDHAIYAPVGDAESFASGIQEALQTWRDPAKSSGRRRWARQWTWSRCAGLTIQAYERARSQ